MNSRNMPQPRRERISIGLFSAQLASTDLARGSGRFLTVARHLVHLKITVLTRASLVDPINIERDSRIGRKPTCLCGCRVASERRSNGGARVARSMSVEVDDCFCRDKVRMRKEQE
jgi:hypothetical protein